MIQEQEVIQGKQPTLDRRKPLLLSSNEDSSSPRSPERGARVGEVVGGTTAECAAVCCCCPCGLMKLLVLAIYKVPAGLWRKAMRKKRRRWMIKKAIQQPNRSRRGKCFCDDAELQVHRLSCLAGDSMVRTLRISGDELVVEVEEEEMWECFYSNGFWRSRSQRTDDVER